VRRVVLAVGCAVVFAAAASCRTATQITLEITSDACADDIAIYVGGGEAPATPATVSHVCPGTLVLVPSDSNTASVAIVLAQGRGKAAEDCAHPAVGDRGCVVARRRIGFVPHTSLSLPIALDQDCAGIPCDEASTCLHGRCVSAEISPSCTDLTACVDASAGDTSADGSAVDATRPDAAGDAARDGELPPVDAPVSDAPLGDAGTPAFVGSASPLRAIVVAGGRLYYSLGPELAWTPLGGGGLGTGVVYGGATFDSLAVLNGVVWAGSSVDGVVRAYEGISLAPTGASVPYPARLVATDGTALWISTGTPTGAVRFEPPSLTTTYTQVGTPAGIAASPAGACWFGPAVRTLACNSAAGTPLLVESSGGERAVAMNSTRVYWSDAAGNVTTSLVGQILSAQPLATGHSAVAMVANDAAIYWMEDDGSVFRLQLPAGTPQPIAKLDETGNLGLLQSLAIDATYLYAISFVQGTVLRFPL
jgi:hypothetical protein